ncbi:MAG: hypothetical protein FWD17_07795 [Polyangiaceae bacterium]|nr:hypothetical protein [Polyangiaceae bacterium]
MEQKRRLPLVASGPEPEGAVRPGWQWVGFGALAIIVSWLPLSAIALSIAGTRITAVAVASAASLTGAALGGGFLVGKWGGPHAAVREAGLAGLVAGLGAVVASGWAFGFNLAALAGGVAVIAVSTPAAALGGRAGVRRR